jgi:hypothetical protein
VPISQSALFSSKKDKQILRKFKLMVILNETGDVCINVTLRPVRVTTVAVEHQEILNILSVCLWT